MIAILTRRCAYAALVAFALMAPSSVVHAQKPTTTAIALAREIIVLKGSVAMIDPLVDGIIDQIKFMHLRTNPLLSKPLEEVAAQLRKEFSQVTSDLQLNVAELYASRFSETELKQILAFYKTPVGQKVVKEEPLILNLIVKQIAPWQERFGEEILARFRAEMKKRGHDL